MYIWFEFSKQNLNQMKNSILFLIVILSYSVQGQSFYKSFIKPEFKSLLEKGVFFIETGDAEKDAAYISAVEDNWDVTDFTILNSIDETEKFSGEEVFLTESVLTTKTEYTSKKSSIIGLSQLKYLRKSSGVSKYTLIGFIAIDGYDQQEDAESKMRYLNQSISGLNDVVKSIKDNRISKIGLGLYKSIYKSFLKKSKPLQSKTLLIVGDTKKYVNLSALEKADIKYKLVSISEYEKLKEQDLSNFCLMYFAYNAFTEISIYNLENNDLIYTSHFINGKDKFSKSDISKMKRKWK